MRPSVFATWLARIFMTWFAGVFAIWLARIFTTRFAGVFAIWLASVISTGSASVFASGPVSTVVTPSPATVLGRHHSVFIPVGRRGLTGTSKDTQRQGHEHDADNQEGRRGCLHGRVGR
ncbi:hypothetical protein LZ199_33970 [Myxococcus sp. QH3KD-4-1]|nr:hypothetical protein [Myxococcus qinghaiensis]